MDTIWTPQRRPAAGHIGGVCAGIAQRLGIDALLVRTAAIILALSLGIGVVVYAAAWLALPTDDGRQSPLQRLLPGRQDVVRVLLALLMVVACIIVSQTVGKLLPFGLFPAVVLGGLVWIGYRQKARALTAKETTTAPSPAMPTPFEQAAAVWTARVAAVWGVCPPVELPAAAVSATESVNPGPVLVTPKCPAMPIGQFWAHPDPAGIYTPDEIEVPERNSSPHHSAQTTRVPPVERTTRGPRWLWPMTLALASIIVGVLAIMASVGITIPGSVYIGAIACLVGLALVVAASTSRPRGLLVAGLVSGLAAAAVIGAGTWQFTAPADEQVIWTSVDEIPPQRSFPIGDHVIDLRQLDLTRDASSTIKASVGDVRILLPRSENVRLHVRLFGNAKLPDENRDGAVDTVWEHRPDPSAPILTLSIEIRVGNLEVTTS